MLKNKNKIIYTTRGRTIEQNNSGSKLPPIKNNKNINLQSKATKNNYLFKKSK